MSRLLLCVALAALAGCSTLTPAEQRTAEIAGGVLVAGAVAALVVSRDGHHQGGWQYVPRRTGPTVIVVTR